MELWEIILLSAALAMDAFAVSICKGLASKQRYLKTGLICGFYFGIFQGLMPLIGYLLGSTISSIINKFAPYVAFILLAFLGIKMIVEALNEVKESKNLSDEEKCCQCNKDSSLSFKVMIVFAFATSIDALAAGLTFVAMEVDIILAVSLIALLTFIFCFFGSIIGAKLGAKFKDKATILGGVVLLAIGLKILIEHLINIL